MPVPRLTPPSAPRRVARVLDAWLPLTVALLTASCMGLHFSAWPLTAAACFLVLGARSMIAVLTGDPWMQRVVLAAAIGVGGAWSSVAWNTDSTDGVPIQQWSEWRVERGLSITPYETLVVGGWPLRGIEGHGRGGAPERLPPGKGMAAMNANIACWAGGALLLSLAIPLGWVPVACLFSLLVGFAGYCLGFARLVWMLD